VLAVPWGGPQMCVTESPSGSVHDDCRLTLAPGAMVTSVAGEVMMPAGGRFGGGFPEPPQDARWIAAHNVRTRNGSPFVIPGLLWSGTRVAIVDGLQTYSCSRLQRVQQRTGRAAPSSLKMVASARAPASLRDDEHVADRQHAAQCPADDRTVDAGRQRRQLRVPPLRVAPRKLGRGDLPVAFRVLHGQRQVLARLARGG